MLLAGGLQSMGRVLPGFADALQQGGALPFDVGEQGAVRLAHGWLPREPAGITMFACSRALIEHVVRQRIDADRLVIGEGHVVRRLVADGRGRVVGVVAEHDGQTTETRADLTVVATGRGPTLGPWLQALGYPAVEQERVGTGFRYVSRWVQRPADFSEGWRLLSIAPTAAVPRGGAAFEAEGDRFGVVLVLPQSEPSPRDDAEFLRVASTLADPALHALLLRARPLGPIAVHTAGASQRHLFEHLHPWPQGVVPLGDAIASLDPYFGLGMTSCLRGVEALAEHSWADDDAAARFVAEAARRLQWPWTLVTEQFSPAVGPQVHLRRSVARLAPTQPEIARILLRRMHMLDPPEVLERPPMQDILRQIAAG